MISSLRKDKAWIDIVDQFSLDLVWTSDSESPGGSVAHLGPDIIARVWPTKSGSRTRFSYRVSWRGHTKNFSNTGELSLATAKRAATLGVAMMVAEMVYDASTSSAV